MRPTYWSGSPLFCHGDRSVLLPHEYPVINRESVRSFVHSPSQSRSTLPNWNRRHQSRVDHRSPKYHCLPNWPLRLAVHTCCEMLRVGGTPRSSIKFDDQASSPAIEVGTIDLQNTRWAEFHELHGESKGRSDLSARVLHKDQTHMIRTQQDFYSNLDLAGQEAAGVQGGTRFG